jgi:hypothetical protein
MSGLIVMAVVGDSAGLVVSAVRQLVARAVYPDRRALEMATSGLTDGGVGGRRRARRGSEDSPVSQRLLTLRMFELARKWVQNSANRSARVRVLADAA